MSKPLRLALAGATGFLGTALRERLAESQSQPAELHLLASAESAGTRLEYAGRYLVVGDLAEFDFHAADAVVFATPAPVTAAHAERARAAGCKVLDFSGCYLADMDVPLLCPGVSPGSRADVTAFPGAIALQLAALLATPVADELLAAVDITAILPASLAGRAGVDELASQTAALLNTREPQAQVFPDRLAFQLLMAGNQAYGSSHQSLGQGAVLALKRLFGLSLPVSCQACFAPVFHGLTLNVLLTCHEEVDEGRVETWLDDAGISLLPQDAGACLLPEEAGAGIYAFMPRDVTRDPHKIRLWLVADNVSLSAFMGVQIIEVLIKDHLY